MSPRLAASYTQLLLVPRQRTRSDGFSRWSTIHFGRQPRKISKTPVVWVGCRDGARRRRRDSGGVREAQELWRGALEAHRSAPPDAGFSGRLAELAEAARAEAAACLAAGAAGFEWPPHRASSSLPPWELQPGSGRRGPEALWRRFDGAVSDLNRVATGTDLGEVARAYQELADVGAELAATVGREDRASGLLPRARSRRSA